MDLPIKRAFRSLCINPIYDKCLTSRLRKGRLLDAVRGITLFGSLAVVCVSVPGFASVKGFLIAATWICLAVRIRFQIGFVLWFFSVLANLIICYEIALLHGVLLNDLFNHFSRLLLFFLVLSIGVMTSRLGIINTRRLDAVIFSIAFLSAILKIAIVTLILSGLYSLDAAQSALGFETVSAEIGLGLQRLQFPSDIILIFLIACYWGGRSKAVDALLMLAVTVSVLLSYSRYLFVAYGFCLALRYYRLKKLDTVSRAAILLGVTVCLFFSASLADRFSGEGTISSDETRTVQMRALTDVILRHFAFGTGIGSSVNGYTRSDTMPFSYEVEWYAMAMQLGFFGLFWFMGNLLVPLVSCVTASKSRVFMVSIFAIWALAGFTNPYVTSLGSAFGFCILILSVESSKDSWLEGRALAPMAQVS